MLMPTKWETVTADTPAKLGGAFAMIASALEQREQALQKKVEDDTQNTVAMADLNPQEQHIVKYLLADQFAATQGLTHDQIHDKFPDVAELQDLLTDLTK